MECIFDFTREKEKERALKREQASQREASTIFRVESTNGPSNVPQNIWPARKSKSQRSKGHASGNRARIIRFNSIKCPCAFCISVQSTVRERARLNSAARSAALLNYSAISRLYTALLLPRRTRKIDYSRPVAAVSFASDRARIGRESCLANGCVDSLSPPPSPPLDSRQNKFRKMPARGRLNARNFGNTLRPACDPIFVKYERYETRVRLRTR